FTQSSFFIRSDEKASGTAALTDGQVQITEAASVLRADLTDSVAFEIGYSVPEVQSVFAVLGEDRVMHVWAIVSEYDHAVYRRIYAKEKQIIKQFVGVVFDFNVIPSHGRDPRNLVCDPGVILAFVRN